MRDKIDATLEKCNERLIAQGWPRLSTLYTDTQNSPYLAGITSVALAISGMRSRSLLMSGIAVGFGFSTYTIKYDIEYGASSNVAWTLVYAITTARNLKKLPLTALVGMNAYFYGREMFDL